MKKSEGGNKAMELEFIEAFGRGRFVNKKLYAVEGVPGLFRRVKDPGVSDPVSVGILPCWFGGTVVYLTPANSEASELGEAGFDLGEMTDQASGLLMKLHVGCDMAAAMAKSLPPEPDPSAAREAHEADKAGEVKPGEMSM